MRSHMFVMLSEQLCLHLSNTQCELCAAVLIITSVLLQQLNLTQQPLITTLKLLLLTANALQQTQTIILYK